MDSEKMQEEKLEIPRLRLIYPLTRFDVFSKGEAQARNS